MLRRIKEHGQCRCKAGCKRIIGVIFEERQPAKLLVNKAVAIHKTAPSEAYIKRQRNELATSSNGRQNYGDVAVCLKILA